MSHYEPSKEYVEDPYKQKKHAEEKKYQKKSPMEKQIEENAGMMSTIPQIQESFQWMLDSELKPIDKGKNKVTIRGKVLFPTVSKNMREYVKSELMRGARTLSGKAINLNHSNVFLGNVIRSEYDETDDSMEFFGEINKQPYVDKIRAKDPSFKGWSVSARYLFNACPKCQEKFTTEQEFLTHMNEVENIRNVVWQPRGIMFDGLAYVESPEVAGVEGTTLEVMETTRGLSALMETLVKEYAAFPTGLASKDKSTQDEFLKTAKTIPAPYDPKLQLGEPCSPELKACVEDLISQGKSEESAWAICRSKIGESSTTQNEPTSQQREKLGIGISPSSLSVQEALKKLEPLPEFQTVVKTWDAKAIEMQDTIKDLKEKLAAKNVLPLETKETENITAPYKLKLSELEDKNKSLEEKVSSQAKEIIILENFKDKVHGAFKGHSPSVMEEKKDQAPVTSDPMKA